MTESRRLLRYTFPGLVFLGEFAIYLFFSVHFDDIIKVVENLNKYSMTKSIVFLVSAFIISGSLGYFFSIISHLIYHYVISCRYKKSYISMLKYAIDNNWLTLKYVYFSGNCNNIKIDKLNSINELKNIKSRDIWCIINVFWHSQIELSKRIQGANTRADSLSDIVHGLGSTLIGSIFALILWIWVYSSFDLGESTCISWILAIGVPIIHLCSYCVIVKISISFVNKIIINEFKKRYETFEIYISETDFKRQKTRSGSDDRGEGQE